MKRNCKRHAKDPPYTVTKVLGQVTDELDLGMGRKKVTHVRMVKEYCERKVKRVMLVVEKDDIDDEVVETNDKVKVVGSVTNDKWKTQLKTVTKEYDDILMKVPGSTETVKFGIDTGDTQLIAQRPYKTPETLRKGVEEKIQWLLKKGYIRESSIP